jgi:radial spoke head protein 4A
MTDAEVNDAKAYLLQASSKSGINLYDHLASVITKLLDERPNDPADLLEAVSQQLKAEDLSTDSTTKDTPATTTAFATADTRTKLFAKTEGEDDDLLEDNEAVPPIHDVLNACQLFEDGGVGLGRDETFRIYLALKALMTEQPVTDVSFWGKIMGTQQDYIIAECVYKEGEEPEVTEPEEEPEPEEPELEEGEVPLPKSQFIAPKPLATEPYGEGANKKVYFVCNNPGEPWVVLPLANPTSIAVSRKIRKYFTGVLTTAVSAYPPFPGTEADLLRASIARISAECHLSPLGLYTLDEDDGDEDEERQSFIPDEEYEGCSKSALLEPGMSGWAHHVLHILPQGRCKWVNPAPPKPEGDDDDEEEEEEEEVEPETGPPLLTPAQEDEPIDDGPAWSVKLTSPLNAGYSGVMASSNKWPGAHAVCWGNGRSYENIYVGHGHVYTSEAYSPPLPPAAQAEYTEVEGEISETLDPTREEEEAYEAEQNQGEDDEDED